MTKFICDFLREGKKINKNKFQEIFEKLKWCSFFINKNSSTEMLFSEVKIEFQMYQIYQKKKSKKSKTRKIIPRSMISFFYTTQLTT